MRPAGSLGDRPGRTIGRIELIEARIGISLENARIAVQMALRMLAGAIARVEEHRGRRITAAERAIVANVDPRPPGCRLTFGQHRHGGVVTVHADRKSTRLNSSHANISYAVFCLK